MGFILGILIAIGLANPIPVKVEQVPSTQITATETRSAQQKCLDFWSRGGGMAGGAVQLARANCKKIKE